MHRLGSDVRTDTWGCPLGGEVKSWADRAFLRLLDSGMPAQAGEVTSPSWYQQGHLGKESGGRPGVGGWAREGWVSGGQGSGGRKRKRKVLCHGGRWGGGGQISRWEGEPNQTLLSRNSRTELRKDQWSGPERGQEWFVSLIIFCWFVLTTLLWGLIMNS